MGIYQGDRLLNDPLMSSYTMESWVVAGIQSCDVAGAPEFSNDESDLLRVGCEVRRYFCMEGV